MVPAKTVGQFHERQQNLSDTGACNTLVYREYAGMSNYTDNSHNWFLALLLPDTYRYYISFKTEVS
jgi:hypothetical protein